MIDIYEIKKQFRKDTFLYILHAIAERPLLFTDIKKKTGMDDSLVDYYLKRLQELRIIGKTPWGTYYLIEKIPFCYLCSRIREIIYVGLLGQKHYHTEPEPITAIRLLKKEGYKINDVIVITTRTAISTWGTVNEDILSIITVEDKDILSIEKMTNIIFNIVDKQSRKTAIILDCTSLTKPATIAMYNISTKYLIPLIYIYEQTKQLHWILRPEDIGKMLRNIF